ncbi:MAG: hypothetical protein SchgKO_06530 [Schleiferiaceae bacterium]
MKIKIFTLCCLLFSLYGWSQIHDNAPLVDIPETADLTLTKDSLMGWSKSKDDQWRSEKAVIPLRGFSFEKPNKYERRIGIDNISSLERYSLVIDGKRYDLFLKFFNRGYFKFPKTKTDWVDEKVVSYYLVDSAAVETIEKRLQAENYQLDIPVYASGELVYAKDREVKSILRSFIVPKPNSKRVMTLAYTKRTVNGRKYVFFQLYERHTIFKDVRGIAVDQKRNGLSIYETDKVLNELHYQIPEDQFKAFFTQKL